MTEPSLLTCCAPMSEAGFKTFCRKSGPAFAQAAAEIVAAGSEDFLLLRYLKKEQALYLAFVFRWADRSKDIERRDYFNALLEAGPLMPEGGEAWVMIAYGAMNFLSDGIDKAWLMSRDGARESMPDAAALARYDALLNANLFRKGLLDKAYQAAMQNSTVLAAALRKQAETLLGVRRRRMAVEMAPKATPEKPVCFFSGYHYNGRFVVRYDTGVLTPLPTLDPATMEQKPWGAVDARHAVIGDAVVETDPAVFRAVKTPGGSELSFYRDSRFVYSAQGEPLAGADPATFRHVKAGYLRDDKSWWFFDATPLVGVGDQARVFDELYFFASAFLIGEAAVYVGKRRLDADAATFEILRSEVVMSPHYRRQNGLVHGRDKDGEFIVSIIEGEPAFERTREPKTIWEKFTTREPAWSDDLAYAREIEAFRPRWLDEAAYADGDVENLEILRGYVAAFEPWFDREEPRFRAAPIHALNANSTFWRAFISFFYACRHIGADEKLARLYRRLEPIAWAQPELFLYAPRSLARLGAKAEAAEALGRGMAAGCDMGFFFASPEAATLDGNDKYVALKAFYERHGWQRKPFLSFGILESIAATSASIKSEGDIASDFFIPSNEDIDAAFSDPAEAAAYRNALTRATNDYARRRLAAGGARLDKDFYRRVRELPDLPAATHLLGAMGLFSEGWFWIDLSPTLERERNEFVEAMQALVRMKQALARDGAMEDPLWRQVMARGDLKPFAALAP